MTKTVSTLLLLVLAGTVALAAPTRRPARKPAPAKESPTPKDSATKSTPNESSQTLTMSAAPAADEVTLYAGKAAGPTTLSIANWGGGSGQDSTETYLFGGHSLKVTTLDLFQGAQITFPTPISLAGANRVFQLTLRRGGATLHYDPRTTSALPPGEAPGNTLGETAGGFGNLDPSQSRPQGRNGRRRGQRNRGGAPAETPVIPPVTNLRLLFTFADGRQSDILRPMPDSSDALAGAGWYSINVPVSALKLGGESPPMLKSVTVGGDHYGVFFVGRIKLGTDVPALAITIDGPDSVLPGQPVTLTAKGSSGFSALKYTWDLDSGNGAADQTNGEEITTRYFEGGQDHTVTLTVTDLDSLKTPITVTKVIHVKEGNNGPGGFPGAGPGNGPGPGSAPGPRPGAAGMSGT